MKIKLSDIKRLTIELELPGGEVKAFDPFECAERLQTEIAVLDGTLSSMFDAIRRVFGFPTQAEVISAPVDAKPFTLDRQSCFELQRQLYAIIDEAVDPKKK